MEDNRNIIDYYKYWNTDAIIADLDTKRQNYSILISNKLNDFNIGSVIRNANAFMAKEVILYGKKKFDHRGAVGTHHYTHFRHVKTINELNELDLSESFIVGVDNIENAKPIENFIWPKNQHIVLVFGQEDVGLAPELLALCQECVYIKQYGSVRSLNVGCASAITMFSLCSQIT
jgi:tRNA G18 (ribose-2'-O)-methylase SpoU